MQGLVDEVRPGQLVSSTQGRDTGRYYLVVSKSEDGFILVTDGEYRGIEKPKKKNPKHLKFWPQFSEKMAERLANKSKVTNAEIMAEIGELLRLLQG
ncbi:50S ribosomal protein L14 [Desulforamulus ferrireducens]|uniref:50S ribosomal protein L14 n=1 Tax=Desulforamulus ferrireducens TaxID=1833852 RepID=A0A1S6IT92_9FIRM|nr:50S ribosomal protein L14 [Desulforamulus ferrireducens]